MRNPLKYTLLILVFACISGQLSAQTGTTKKMTTTTKSKTTSTTHKTKKPAPKTTVPGKEVTISVKNNCEKQVPIFAGPREGLRAPKIKTIGGLSTDKFYVHVNEVICLMSEDGKKPKACKDVKASVTTLEVNSSATELK